MSAACRWVRGVPAGPVVSAPAKASAENALLCCLASIDDVEAWLVHLGPLVYSVPGHARAEISVRILEPDSGRRAALLDRKRDVLEKARALLELVSGAGSDMMRALRRDEAARMCRVDAEDLAMVRTYVEHVERLRPVAS